MLSITDGVSLARVLHSPTHPGIKELLRKRRDQLGGDIAGQAHFVIVEVSDTLGDLEAALGFSVCQNAVDESRFGELDFTPCWEWIEDHGFAYELVFIFTDDGYSHVVIVENVPGVDAQLLDLCAAHASEHA